MSIVKLYNFPILGDERGSIVVLDKSSGIPFEIKRVYYIYELDSKNISRGFHAHKELEQVVFCLNGSFKMMVDDGIKKEVFLHDSLVALPPMSEHM